jgi:hypothetical protein
MENDPRYVPVENALPPVLPPCSRVEAAKATRRIVRHFGGTQHGGPDMLQPVRWQRVRVCWLSSVETKGTNHHKGWGRLIHDLSHIIFDRRHPTFRSHHGTHALLEREIAEWVVAQGFLTGKLRPQDKSKRKAPNQELEMLAGRLKKWQSKFTRAQNAIKKLHRRRKVLERRLATRTTTASQEPPEAR